jgi:hypothetical protein
MAAAHDQKERALKVIAKYTRVKNPKLIDELYSDANKFLDRIPLQLRPAGAGRFYRELYEK